MKKRKPLETDIELAQALDKLFDEISLPETPEDIDAFLREAGYDPDEVATNMQLNVEQALANSPLNWRNREQTLQEEKHKSDATPLTSLPTKAELLQTLQQLFTRQPELATHFRNFETMSANDLADLVKDIEYLSSQQNKEGENQK